MPIFLGTENRPALHPLPLSLAVTMEPSLTVLPSPPPSSKMPYMSSILKIITRASKANGVFMCRPWVSALTTASLPLNQLYSHTSSTPYPLPASSSQLGEPHFPGVSSSSSPVLVPCPSLLDLVVLTPRMGHEDILVLLCPPYMLSHSLVFLLPFLDHPRDLQSHLHSPLAI